MPRDLVNEKQAAMILNVSRQRVSQLRLAGKLSPVEVDSFEPTPILTSGRTSIS